MSTQNKCCQHFLPSTFLSKLFKTYAKLYQISSFSDIKGPPGGKLTFKKSSLMKVNSGTTGLYNVKHSEIKDNKLL